MKKNIGDKIYIAYKNDLDSEVTRATNKENEIISNLSSEVTRATNKENEILIEVSKKSDSSHTHDDRYYTESEINTKLNGKSNTDHTHTKSSITDFSHTHDDRYYTESEINTKLNGKSNTDHTHNYIPTNASCNKNWNWSGQEGQPPWIWGGSDGTNMYVYNPSNFNVNYASSAGSAGEAGHANLLATYADDGHYLCPDRYDSWNTRLYMTYGDKSVKANNVHVYYADSSGYANSAGSAGSATWASNADIFSAGELYTSRSHWGDSTAAPNMRIGSDNRIMATSGSSKRWKNSITTDINDNNIDPHKLYDVNVFQYKYNTDYTNEKDIRHDIPLVGFIAEDLYDTYRIACDYNVNEDGEVECEGWNPMFIIPSMLKLIQEQHEEIEKLKKIVSKYEENKR